MEAQDLTAELVAVEDEGAPDAQPNCSSDESLLASMKHTDGPKIPKCKYNPLSTPLSTKCDISIPPCDAGRVPWRKGRLAARRKPLEIWQW